jgi:hypothetical protein
MGRDDHRGPFRPEFGKLTRKVSQFVRSKVATGAFAKLTSVIRLRPSVFHMSGNLAVTLAIRVRTVTEMFIARHE